MTQGKNQTDAHYWAATDNPKLLASRLRERIDRFFDVCNTTGRMALWGRASRMFYGLDAEFGYRRSHYVQFEGAQGESLGFVINLYRSFTRSLLALTTSQRPSFAAKPIAYDAQTTETVAIANAYMDKLMDEAVEPVACDSELKRLLYGEAAVLTTWDDAAGRVVGSAPVLGEDGLPVGERPVAAGALRMLALRPDEVVRDPDVNGGPDRHSWFCGIVQRNRWDLMAQYPAYAEQIHNAPTVDQRWLFGLLTGLPNGLRNVNNDCVTTYELYHRRSLAMPDGLFALMVGDTIVSMGPLQYEDLPFDFHCSDRDPASSLGYADTWDLMAPQQLASSSAMQAGTTKENFGRPTIWIPEGAQPEPYDMAGPRLIQGGATPPVVLDMEGNGVTSGAAFLELMTGLMQRMSGISDASFGNVGASTSGVALAQQQQQTLVFNSPTGISWGKLLQGMMTKSLRIAQKFMPDEQMIHITGRLSAPMVKRFKTEDFANIEGISVEIGSAPMRSSGTRHAIATELLQANGIQDPRIVEAFTEFIATGRTQPLLEGARLRETQCERLMLEVQEGRGYIVTATMPHAMMIDRIAQVLSDPSASPEVQQIGMTLIQQHSELWASLSTNPMGMTLLYATGQQPSPAAQMMAPPMPPQGPSASEQAAPEGNPMPDNQDVPNRENAPAPSPSGQQSDVSPQPNLPEGAQPYS